MRLRWWMRHARWALSSSSARRCGARLACRHGRCLRPPHSSSSGMRSALIIRPPGCVCCVQSSITLHMLGQEVTYEVLNVMEYTSDRCAWCGWQAGLTETSWSKCTALCAARCLLPVACCVGGLLVQALPGCGVLRCCLMLLTHRGCMSVIARSPDGTIRLFCKGSDAKVTAVLLSCWLKAEQAQLSAGQLAL